MTATLLNHDRDCCSAELPLIYGYREKDTITARNLIMRIQTAAEIAQWPDVEFFMILRYRALIWWETLEHAGINNKVSNDVETAFSFLKAYERKYTAKMSSTNFADILQHQGETDHDYFPRLQETFSKLLATIPKNMGTIRMAIPVAPAAIYTNSI